MKKSVFKCVGSDFHRKDAKPRRTAKISIYSLLTQRKKQKTLRYLAGFATLQ